MINEFIILIIKVYYLDKTFYWFKI